MPRARPGLTAIPANPTCDVALSGHRGWCSSRLARSGFRPAIGKDEGPTPRRPARARTRAARPPCIASRQPLERSGKDAFGLTRCAPSVDGAASTSYGASRACGPLPGAPTDPRSPEPVPRPAGPANRPARSGPPGPLPYMLLDGGGPLLALGLAVAEDEDGLAVLRHDPADERVGRLDLEPLGAPSGSIGLARPRAAPVPIWAAGDGPRGLARWVRTAWPGDWRGRCPPGRDGRFGMGSGPIAGRSAF
jgi:hypothetical protein